MDLTLKNLFLTFYYNILKINFCYNVIFERKIVFIVAARYLFLCDEDFTILENQAFVFEDKILELGELDNLKKIS